MRLIENYNKLDGGHNHNVSVIRQKDVAEIYEEAIKGIDQVLQQYVKFQ